MGRLRNGQAMLGAVVGVMAWGAMAWGAIYSPQDFSSSGLLVVTEGSAVINTGTAGDGGSIPSITVGTTTYYGTWQAQTAVIEGETFQAQTAVFCFDEIEVRAGVNVVVNGSRGLALLSKGDISWKSTLDVGSAGASNYGCGNSPDGAGTGGGYGGPGQWSFSSSIGWLTPGGQSYGEPTLASILLGGSSGGWGKVGGMSGAGGGAVELVADGTLTVDAIIRANGGNGAATYWGGGGGSGGAVLLKARRLAFGEDGGIEALGGTCPTTMNVGASGSAGRVALYYSELVGFEPSDVSIYSRPGWIWNAWSPDGDGRGTLYMEPVAVPEPGTLMVVGLGGAGLLARRRRVL